MSLIAPVGSSWLLKLEENSGTLQVLNQEGNECFETSLEKLTSAEVAAVRKFFDGPNFENNDMLDSPAPLYSAVVTPQTNEIKISFFTVWAGGLRERDSPTVTFRRKLKELPRIFDWAVELAESSSRLKLHCNLLTNRLGAQNLIMNEMVQAHEAQRSDMLARVCAVLDDRSELNFNNNDAQAADHLQAPGVFAPKHEDAPDMEAQSAVMAMATDPGRPSDFLRPSPSPDALPKLTHPLKVEAGPTLEEEEGSRCNIHLKLESKTGASTVESVAASDASTVSSD